MTVLIHDDAVAGIEPEEIEERRRAAQAVCEEILRRWWQHG